MLYILEKWFKIQIKLNMWLAHILYINRAKTTKKLYN